MVDTPVFAGGLQIISTPLRVPEKTEGGIRPLRTVPSSKMVSVRQLYCDAQL